MSTYTTKSGDMWDVIAKEKLGSEMYTNKLMEANPKHMDTAVFSAGVVLEIPVIAETTTLNLPPWRR